jgi:hypothetical protein
MKMKSLNAEAVKKMRTIDLGILLDLASSLDLCQGQPGIYHFRRKEGETP